MPTAAFIMAKQIDFAHTDVSQQVQGNGSILVRWGSVRWVPYAVCCTPVGGCRVNQLQLNAVMGMNLKNLSDEKASGKSNAVYIKFKNT